MAPGNSPQDRVLPATRVLAAVIIPFLLLAFLVLVPWPSDTKRLFAWAIKPSMSAMVLGSVYLGGAYFFVRVLGEPRWHCVAGGFLPVATFAGLMAITTILHWSRFIHGNLAFWLWIGLYFTTPLLVLAVFLRNQREYGPGDAGDPRLSSLAAVIIAAAGGLSLLTSAFLFLFPYRAVSIWPWPLTPLTARMMGAIFALGLAGLGVIHERRWSSARILLQVAGFMLLLILISAARARSQFDTSKPLTWLFLVGFVATVLTGGLLYLRMQRRARTSGEVG
ncbi:hypothetical protein SAMN05892883_0129 [Jatrophihabitans sp. GAS493]|uniref:hypothetical protein n=1 Tax=Jatrophihabitans sp. GAS493 TaxID=1907575 RepID=UPI000BB7DDEB|nr:hypothetical protein [Jatrophihabitans sp. GAS493]SOD70429.1 hypothetical protein SAMN05892883_0129 [Jatrophihabitans sp. GAS493]